MKSHLFKTFSPKAEEMERKWVLIDAKDKTLGRISTTIADILRGKNKVTYSPHLDCGDFVVVINAAEVKLTGNKMEDKEYNRHSRFPGGLKTETPATLIRRKQPERILEHSVAGMIPNNKLKKHILKKLKVFAGAEHDHAGQNPTPIEL